MCPESYSRQVTEPECDPATGQARPWLALSLPPLASHIILLSVRN